jgi:hypothetical protein
VSPSPLIEDQQTAADYDGRIGHIERRPLILAYIEQQKIRHAAGNQAVEQIPRRASQNQREGQA